MPWRSRAERIAEGKRDAAKLRGEAESTRQIAAKLSLRVEREHLIRAATEMDAAAQRIERRTQELVEEPSGPTPLPSLC
jgi:hypothetical protein